MTADWACVDLNLDPVTGLYRKLAAPAAIGMLFTTLTNIVDTFFGGMLSASALAGMALASPVFFMVLTFGIGIGHSTNALVGNRLGANRPLEAKKLALQATSFAITLSSSASLLAFILAPWLFEKMGASDPYLQLAVIYIRVVLTGTLFFSLSLVMNSILNTRGDTLSYRNAQVIGFFANAVLDAFFIFVLDMGVAGLATATVLVQASIFGYLLLKVLKLDFMQTPTLSDLVPIPALYKEVAQQSFPNTVSMMLVALGSLIVVSFVSRFGESAMAAFGVALRLEQVMLLPILGLSLAALSMTSVNFGAGHAERIREVFYTGVGLAACVALAGGTLLFLSGEFLMRLFNDDPDVVAIGTQYLKYESVILPAYAMTFIGSSVLQGLKRPIVVMMINAVRQVLAQLLLFWIAIELLGQGVSGIWKSLVLINWVAAAVMLAVARHAVTTMFVDSAMPARHDQGRSP